MTEGGLFGVGVNIDFFYSGYDHGFGAVGAWQIGDVKCCAVRFRCGEDCSNFCMDCGAGVAEFLVFSNMLCKAFGPEIMLRAQLFFVMKKGCANFVGGVRAFVSGAAGGFDILKMVHIGFTKDS